MADETKVPEQVAAGEVELPAGWRIEREEHERFVIESREREVREVAFAIFEDEAMSPANVTRAVFDRAWGEWCVSPGMMKGRIEPAEARVRGIALALAAEECERRNG